MVCSQNLWNNNKTPVTELSHFSSKPLLEIFIDNLLSHLGIQNDRLNVVTQGCCIERISLKCRKIKIQGNQNGH